MFSKYMNFGSCVSMGSNNSINMSNGKITINGKTIKVPNNANVSVINGTLYVNGEKYQDGEIENKEVINITIEGNVNKVECGGSVTVNGDVSGMIDCGGSVTGGRDVEGNVDCGGSCTVRGKQQGRIDAGGKIMNRNVDFYLKEIQLALSCNNNKVDLGNGFMEDFINQLKDEGKAKFDTDIVIKELQDQDTRVYAELNDNMVEIITQTKDNKRIISYYINS